MTRIALFLCFVLCATPVLPGAKIVLKDGRILEGKIAELAKVDEGPEEVGKTRVRLIVVLDDGLRYVYFPKYNIRPDQIPEDTTSSLEIFRTKLAFSREGRVLDKIGEYDSGIRFDPFGRRLLPLRHYGGIEFASQAITELTPRYVRARGIHLNNAPFVWDMRLATNSIPRDQLTPILMNQIDPKDYDDRIRLVRFYIQGDQYENAVEELDAILRDWNDDPDVKQRLSGIYRTIDIQRYQRRLDELELRWKAGQHDLVRRFLLQMENDDKLPEQLFMAVRRKLQRYDDFEKKRTDAISQLRSLYDKLPEEEKDERLKPVLDEIAAELNLNTIDRLATFQLYAGDANVPDSEKLAIGITGWFAGSNADNRRLAVAASFPETRRLILEYLQSGNETLRQQDIIERLKALESSRPDLVAKILAYMKPPTENPEPDSERPGYFRFEIDNPIQGTVEKIDYVVQLPPEYDPNRRYPVIVTLNGLTQTPDMQLDWWVGPWRGKERYGQATRHGYIVIAPNWNPSRLLDYDFSAFAHAAVLYSLKDAFRRFNVDTDRVYLTGHGIGGTAAWDIALAHPDLWAGAVPFNAVASKYIVAYKNNLQHVPFYLVSGELEAINNQGKLALNAPVYNRYLAKQHDPFEVTVVRFIGRGVEGFSDEILRIFEWMNLHQRNVAPMEFETNTMRPWDDFFWWVELGNLNRDKPDYVRDPVFWPEKGGIPKNMISVRSKLLKATNSVQIEVGPKLPNVLVYVTPEMIDFNAKTSIRVGSRNYHPPNGYVEPDIEVMLHDAKTRVDRLHPFWAVLKGR